MPSAANINDGWGPESPKGIGNGGNNIAVAIKAPIQRCGRASVHQARYASSSGAINTAAHLAAGITATSAA